MTRAVAYLRDSPRPEPGLSVDVQRERCTSYAKLYDIELVAVEVDHLVSAKTLHRVGLGRALALLEAGKAEALLVAKLDRLIRSVKHLGTLLERYFADGRWQLLSVAEQIDTRSPGGRLVLNVLASVAQWERETISERTRQALQHRKAQGLWAGGGLAYGMKVVKGRLVEDEFEQRVIRLMEWYRGRGFTYQAIADELNARGLKTRRGCVFRESQVHRLLTQ